jgi:hypothetical protein
VLCVRASGGGHLSGSDVLWRFLQLQLWIWMALQCKAYEERKAIEFRRSVFMKNGRPVPVRVWPVAAPPRAQIVSAFSCVGRDANGNEREKRGRESCQLSVKSFDHVFSWYPP